MTQWFYRAGESKEKGPINATELLELIRQGTIREDTLVRKGSSPWVASSSVNGLWDAAGRPSAAFDCPHCGKPIAKPPVRCASCRQLVQHATGHLVHHRSVTKPSSATTNHLQNTDASRFGSRPGLYD